MKALRIGILGCANIARQFVRDAAPSPAVSFVACASRHADTAAADLVLVAGADAPRGGADRLAIRASFAHLFHHPVERENDVGAVGNGQIRAYVDPRFLEGRHLLHQGEWVDHYAVADDGRHSRAQDAAGDQLQNIFGGANEDGVAGIVAALIPCHDVEAVGKQIDDLSFSFVSPLRA